MSWTVVNTHPGREDTAILNLEKQGYGVYCPKFRKRISHARKTSEVLRPLFPGYVFLKYDLENKGLRSVRSTIGVRDLVRFGGETANVPKKLISELKMQEIDGAIPFAPASLFKNGEKIRLKNGPFADIVATVISCDPQNRLTVLFEFMNRLIHTKVDGDVVEAA